MRCTSSAALLSQTKVLPRQVLSRMPDTIVSSPMNTPSTEAAPLPDYKTDAIALHAALTKRAKTDEPLRTALRVLEGAVRLFTPANLGIAFNGGKDATVVMHLARAVVANAATESESTDIPALHCLYLLGGSNGQDEFPEVECFVREQVAACGLEALEVDAEFKEGISMFTKRRDGLCAFVMGTRRDDPHGKNMQHFEPSSPGWPRFMRVNPILTWDYHDVWRFLRDFRLPYCCMYDRGYTSIGSIATTRPNPALCISSCDGGSSAYRPAWQLEDVSLERAGRLSKAKAVEAETANVNGVKSR